MDLGKGKADLLADMLLFGILKSNSAERDLMFILICTKINKIESVSKENSSAIR